MAGRGLSGQAHVPLVSINIPCYNQLPLARRAIESVLAQSFTAIEFETDRERFLGRGRHASPARFPCPLPAQPRASGRYAKHVCGDRVRPRRYTMAFHEDDLLGTDSSPPLALEAHVARVRRERPARVRMGALAEELAKPAPQPAFDMFVDGTELVRGILRGVEPMFGSVVYRRSAIEDVRPHHEAYATLVDRPYLLSIVKRGWTAAVIREPLAWYRRHGHGDTRHLAMTTDHVLRLLRVYRGRLPDRLNKQDRALFLSYTGYWLFELYRLTPPAGRPPVWRYLFKAWRMGLYDPRARGRFGLRQIQRAVLNQPS